MSFTLRDIPDQTGKLAVITGATGGLGYETALALAGANAAVVLTGRNAEKGAAALAAIRVVHPKADIRYEMLDLASLDSVAAFARHFAAEHDRLDLLVNNGGVMALPQRRVTVDGFEQQFETNHLSHFALTGRLLPQLVKAGARIVNVSSTAHYFGQIDFNDLQGAKSYKPWKAYGQSKIANLLFTFELQRRSEAAGWGLMVNAAHPGFATTELIPNGMGSNVFSRMIVPFLGQPPAPGALPQIFAATSPAAEKAGFYGPQGLFEMKGAVGTARVVKAARDDAVARRLWAVSEQLSGVTYPSAMAAAA